jgi:hypothetical protein
MCVCVCVCVFCVEMRNEGDYFPVQQKRTGYYKIDLTPKAHWSLYVPQVKHSTILRPAHNVYIYIYMCVCFVWK